MLRGGVLLSYTRCFALRHVLLKARIVSSHGIAHRRLWSLLQISYGALIFLHVPGRGMPLRQIKLIGAIVMEGLRLSVRGIEAEGAKALAATFKRKLLEIFDPIATQECYQ